MAENAGRLANKVALITGATGGIGSATAARFLEEGARVMLVDRDEDELVRTWERLGSPSRAAHAAADAADEDATRAAIGAAVQTFGGLDITFANAGTEGAAAPIEAQDLADVETVLRVNVIGVWLAIKHSVEPMRTRGGGSIIATSSAAGVIGFPNLSPYVASKHAVIGLVRTAAAELGASGIRVNAINPGPIDNRMMRSLESQISPDDPEGAKAGISSGIALRRYGTNEDVANLALFLASDEAANSTGAVHLTDGGYTAV